jgi:hypothetical protein
MNGMRKILCFLMAMGLAAFALPGTAAAPLKTYGLYIEHGVTANPVVPPVSVTVWIKNESPPPNTANSNIGSFTFTVYPWSIADTQTVKLESCPVSPFSCNVDTGANYTATPQSITVTNINPPIQEQGFYKVTFGVSSCGDGKVTSAHVFSGSQTNGAEFGGPKSDSDFFNSTITGAPKVPSTSATQILCGSLACSTTSATPFFVQVNEGSGDVCSSGSTLLSCISGVWSGNKDGFCSTDVDYVVTNTLGLTDNSVHVEWFTEPAAVFAYKVNMLTNALPASGLPQVAWSTVNGQPYYIPGDTCNGYPSLVADATTAPTDLLPKQLTALAADVKLTDKKISVTSVTGLPTSGQFDIVIGPYLYNAALTIERMTVTNVNTANLTLSVTRAVGGTSKHFHPAIVGTTPTPVMSTPTKILQSTIGPYSKDDQEQMCVAAKITNGDGTTSFWLIDIGDGWVGLP